MENPAINLSDYLQRCWARVNLKLEFETEIVQKVKKHVVETP